MYRKKVEDLIEWASTSPHKPLIIRGARQVGKSTLVSLFAKEQFFSLLLLNFERNPEFADFFVKNDPKEIIRLLEINFNTDIVAGKTLLFLDEIQAAPQVLITLRYFYEELPALHIIAAGSLLDFELNSPTYSIPVGRLSYLHLHPMGFVEFLLATGQDKLAQFIEDFQVDDVLPDSIHHLLSEQFKIYSAIGGMPEAVLTFAKTRSYKKCEAVKQDLLATFQNDFSKYTRHQDIVLIRKVFSKAPTLIGQKIKYSNISSENRAAEVSRVITLLSNARVLQKVIRSSSNGVPLSAEANHKFYKLIFLDVGLVSSLLNLSAEALEADDLMRVNNGTIAEQWIGQALLLNQHSHQNPELHYWAREKKSSSAELDYVSAVGNQVVGVEVKAGKTGILKSLHLFMKEKNHAIAVRFNSEKPSWSKQDKLLSLPLYFAEAFSRLSLAKIKNNQ
jgi:predicted AAA+ superfamily ATPase